jgi:NAD-dependent deacetylase
VVSVGALAELVRRRGPCVVVSAATDATAPAGASLRAFRTDPRAVWQPYGALMRRIWDSEPDESHRALRRLEAAGHVAAVITTAVDGLQREAGSEVVIELRGSVAQSPCPACGYTEPLGCLLDLLPVPVCAACGATLRPGPLLSDEPPTPEVLAHARHLAGAAGLVLVLGAALADACVAELAELALARGGALALVGAGGTPFDDRATARADGDPGAVIAALGDALCGT